MTIASRSGLSVSIDTLGSDALASLFNEELGAVIQVRSADIAKVHAAFNGLPIHQIATVRSDNEFAIVHAGKTIFDEARQALHTAYLATAPIL